MERKVKGDWSTADKVPVRPVNQFIAQTGPHDHILNLGFVAPPVVLNPENQEPSIPVDVVARVLLTPAKMRELAAVLADSIELREKHKAQK